MKRIAAIVLSDLCTELVGRRLDAPASTPPMPLAVIVDPPGAIEATADAPQDDAKALLHAIDRHAWRYGARPGQTATEASAYVAKLRIEHLPTEALDEARAHVAEMALGYGTTAALKLDRKADQLVGENAFGAYPGGAGAGPHDTVWLDVSGCARLVGGEDLLVAELRKKAHDLGHRARVAIASGPRIAQAVARWGGRAESVVPSGEEARSLASLPSAALPLDAKTRVWLGKLGLLQVGDLARLDRARLAHRLGPRARDLLELIAGRDGMPLLAHQAARTIRESIAFEDAIRGTEPLLFVLRGLVARACSRLKSRGEAACHARLELRYERAIARLRNMPEGAGRTLSIALPIALSHEDDLLRTLHAKLERLDLAAPLSEATLVLEELVAADHAQIDLQGARGASPGALPTLLAELGAWIGTENVGVLEVAASHRPESRSRLVPVELRPKKRQALPAVHAFDRVRIEEPTRVLPAPLPIGALAPQSLLAADHRMFLLDHLHHTARIDAVEWWTPAPVSRDYARAGLRTGADDAAPHESRERQAGDGDRSEAWLYRDRRGGHGVLHGWFE